MSERAAPKEPKYLREIMPVWTPIWNERTQQWDAYHQSDRAKAEREG